MAYDGKRLARTRMPGQLNMDPEMLNDIRALCQRDKRPIGLQLLLIIEVGLQHLRGEQVQSQTRTITHAGAPPRKAAQFDARKNGTNP